MSLTGIALIIIAVSLFILVLTLLPSVLVMPTHNPLVVST